MVCLGGPYGQAGPYGGSPLKCSQARGYCPAADPYPHPLQEIVTEDGFDVLRRVYVDFEGISFKRKFMVGLEPDTVNMMIGECGGASPF